MSDGNNAITIAQLTEQINEKMDRDAHNIQSPSAVVIAKQDPTAENSGTWYRLYSDGWVEQGGYFNTPSADANYTITIPCEMLGNNYTILITGTTGNTNAVIISVETGIEKTTTSFGVRISHKYSNAGTPSITYWQVSGLSKQGN